mgnify:FL=1
MVQGPNIVNISLVLFITQYGKNKRKHITYLNNSTHPASKSTCQDVRMSESYIPMIKDGQQTNDYLTKQRQSST